MQGRCSHARVNKEWCTGNHPVPGTNRALIAAQLGPGNNVCEGAGDSTACAAASTTLCQFVNGVCVNTVIKECVPLDAGAVIPQGFTWDQFLWESYSYETQVRVHSSPCTAPHCFVWEVSQGWPILQFGSDWKDAWMPVGNNMVNAVQGNVALENWLSSATKETTAVRRGGCPR